MPWHSPPHMPPADLDGHLGDIIASFPPPVDFELSFDDLSAIMRGGSPEDSAGMDTQRSSLASSHSTASTIKPLPPPKDNIPADTKPLPRIASGTGKRPIEPATPTRPLKRLKAVFTPRQRSVPRSPSRSSTSKNALPRHRPPSSLQDVLAALRDTQSHLSRSVDALETVRADLDSQKVAAQHGRNAVIELLEEGRRTAARLEEFEEQNAELRDSLRRWRSRSARDTTEAQATIQRLEASLAKEREQSAKLREQVDDLRQQSKQVENSADRRVYQLEQELLAAGEETATAKEEGRVMRARLDEAEFAHRALKEGGAKLQKELDERDKRIEQLEKGKGRRWNMI